MSEPPPIPDGEPITQARVLGKRPPEGRKFPCEKCGSRLDFDPESRELKCPYCGHIQVIERGGDVVEHDLNAFIGKQTSTMHSLIAGRSSEVRCPGCGAIVLLEDKVATEKCPYCNTHLENTPEVAKEMIDPESLLPFTIPNRDAIVNFDKWLHSLWFAPSELKKLANLGQLNGIYVPHWTYDAMTYSWYEGQRGDNYTDTEHYTERDANGNNVSKTRTVTKIRWHSVSGEIDHFFDDVLICGSHSIPAHLLAKLGDWDLPNLEAFKAAFLAGFLTERYAVGVEEGLESAKVIMDGEIKEMCRRDIGGDHQRVSTVETKYVGVTFKHILVPIWLASYRYREKLFQVLVNGRTGVVAGERPWSWWKITRLILLIIGTIGGIFGLVKYFQS